MASAPGTELIAWLVCHAKVTFGVHDDVAGGVGDNNERRSGEGIDTGSGSSWKKTTGLIYPVGYCDKKVFR